MSVLALCLTVVFARQLDLTKHVSITEPAMSASQLADKLGKQLGVDLLTSAEVSKEMLVIYAKDVSAKTLMDQAAKAMHATWIPDGQTLRLVRTAEQRKADQELANKNDLETLQKALGEIRKKAADQLPFSLAVAHKLADKMDDLEKRTDGDRGRAFSSQIPVLDQQTPLGRVTNRILSKFRAADLMALAPGKRVVFASTPTKMQLPFPKEATAELATYVAEQDIWSKVTAQVFGKEPDQDSAGGYKFRGPVDGGLGKALLIATRIGGSLSYTLYVGNKAGRVVGRNQGYLSASEPASPTTSVKPDPTPLQLSPITLEIFKRSNAASSTIQGDPLSPETRKVLLDPETTDPLALWPTDLLQAFAKAKHVNLVATVDDFTAYAFTFARGQLMSVGSFERLLPGLGYVSEEDGGWLRLMTSNPLASRQPSIDRHALGIFLQSVAQKGQISFEDAAQLAFASPGEDYSVMAMAVTPLVADVRRDLYMLHSNFQACRFYGSLTPSQRAACQGEDMLPLSALSAAQQKMLRTIIFEGQGALLVTVTDEMGQQRAVQGLYEFVQGEATEALPDGIPPTTRWSYPKRSETVVFVEGQEGAPGSFLNADSYAYHSYAQSQPNANDLIGTRRLDLNTVRVGQQTQYILRAQFGPTARLYLGSMLEQESGKPQPYAQAPAEFKAAVDAALAKLKK